MSDKRYLGNIIAQNPPAPSGPYESDSASGVWSLAEAFAYTKAGLWPTAGNVLPVALFSGRYANTGGVSSTNVVDKITIPTLGNAVDFGDMVNGTLRECMGGVSSSVRAIFGGGTNSSGTTLNQIQYFTFSTSGNGTDFGDMIAPVERGGGTASSTRGVFAGGYTGTTSTNVMSYVTMASTGNAIDFGDLITTGTILIYNGIISNGSRGIFGGGAVTNVIQFITISSTGNATDFGDISFGSDRAGAACSSSSRGLFAGDQDRINTIQYMTISSSGNTIDFGDLTVGRSDFTGASSKVRGVFGGGTILSPFGNVNTVDYVTISSLGNASDFGDLTVPGQDLSAASNTHGGLP